MTRCIVCAAIVCLTAVAAPAQEAITALDVLPVESVFENALWNRPRPIASMQEAAACFGREALGTLGRQVDFEQQFLLLFAWRGSGGDRLRYTVAESFPEQISFSLKRGLTRDLRPHAHVYALRSNVRWSIQDEANAGREPPAAGIP
jgi:hypothetical protein